MSSSMSVLRARADDAAPGHDEAAGLWRRIAGDARALASTEPWLRRRMHALLAAGTPERMLVQVLSRRLATLDLPEPDLRALLTEVLDAAPELVQLAARDLGAVTERDPACAGPLHVLLNLKGFHALQMHRAAHWLWQQGRRDLAHSLSNTVATVLAIDIHPAARIGSGVMLDHASGIVIGETAVVEDDVSILQSVTLGGTGKEHGDRHPKVRRGVMIGAGATILGNIEIGMMSKVAAGSVVLEPVPPHCTVAGVPARVVRWHDAQHVPAREMDQRL
ncbi:serine O-acetyltransferase [Caldimonas thermodepolymerans]|uniref:serine O-acetyltransferase n=1 Tax=Caldimonas thermodepolymerans TaxID=215580 RepID=UPI00223627E9|nr:serine O-acetyltransferase [Caldimonas thermodepolymerans]UZG43272.1 serine O-acetyltransferase [Caldimonas thermodepolymerans]